MRRLKSVEKYQNHASHKSRFTKAVTRSDSQVSCRKISSYHINSVNSKYERNKMAMVGVVYSSLQKDSWSKSVVVVLVFLSAGWESSNELDDLSQWLLDDSTMYIVPILFVVAAASVIKKTVAHIFFTVCLNVIVSKMWSCANPRSCTVGLVHFLAGWCKRL